MCSPLIGLSHACKISLGGAKRLFLFHARDLEREFITYDLALSQGFYQGGIPLKPGKGFVEIEAWYDTTKFDTEMKLGGGFTHALEFKTLGYDDDVTRLIAILADYPVNALVEGNDGRRYWLGQKHVPLLFDVKAVMPEKGTGRKEVVFSAKQDGLTVPVMPIVGDIYFDWLPDWTFEDYLQLVNRQFDMSFEIAFA